MEWDLPELWRVLFQLLLEPRMGKVELNEKELAIVLRVW